MSTFIKQPQFSSYEREVSFECSPDGMGACDGFLEDALKTCECECHTDVDLPTTRDDVSAYHDDMYIAAEEMIADGF